MKRMFLAILVLAAIAALVFVLRSGPASGLGGPGAGGGASALAPDAGAGSFGGPTAPVAPASGTGGPAADATPSGPATAPVADVPPPAWVPATAFSATTGAIVAVVRLAEEVPAVGAAASLAGPMVRAATTGGEGRLVFGQLTPGTGYKLAIGAAGYPVIDRAGLTVTAGRVTDLGVLDLAGGEGSGPIARPTVRVRAADGDAPIAGARVVLTTVRPYGLYLAFGTEGRPGEVSVERTTDADGRAEFAGIRPGAYDVLAFADGFAMGLRENLTVRRDARDQVELKLPKGLRIAGEVRDPAGAPAAGAAVMALNFGRGFKSYPMATTDESGKFAMTNLDPGGYMVMAFKDGLGSTQSAPNIRPGTENLVLTLKAGASLRGRVVQKADGSPVTSYTIRPYTGGPFGYVYSMAYPINAPDGAFAVTVDAGIYTLEVTAAGFGLAEVSGVKVPLAGEGVTVTLDAAGVVTGVVRRRGTGTPIPGAEIFVRKGGMPPSPHKVIYAVTGPDGSFRLDGLGLAPLNLHVTHADHAGTVVEGVVPRPGEGEAIVVELSGGGAVEGTVMGKDAQPVVGVSVSLFQGLDFLGVRTVKSDGQGKFRFEPVTPGKYSLSAGELQAGQSPGQTLNIEVRDGEVTHVELGKPGEGRADVTGRLTRAGAPVGEVDVSLAPRDRAEGSGTVTVESRTDADGRFTFPRVAAGRYTVFAEVGGSVARAEVEVAGDAAPPPVELKIEPARISGKVISVDGKPIEAVWVTLERVTAGGGGFLQAWQGQDNTDADGTFSISGVPDGTYRVRTFDFNWAYGTEMADGLIVRDGQGTEVTLTVKPARQVSGRITRTDGTPIENASVRALDSAGRDVALLNFATSGSDGSYTWAGLRADNFTFVAEAPGYAPVAVSVDLVTAVTQRADFALPAGATLRIVATDGSGAAVAGAQVVLLNPDGTPVTRGVSIVNLLQQGATATDSSGVARWRDLAAAPYLVRVSKSGLPTTQVNAAAVAGTEVEVKVILAAAGG